MGALEDENASLDGVLGYIDFNRRAGKTRLPPRIIEYLVAHELIHLHEPHHSSAFWERIERALPDYIKRKQWLAEHGGEF